MNGEKKLDFADCDYLNYEFCKYFYGQLVADYFYYRIQQDYGSNGLDLFLDMVPQIDKEVIREYAMEYYADEIGPNLIDV